MFSRGNHEQFSSYGSGGFNGDQINFWTVFWRAAAASQYEKFALGVLSAA